MNDYTDAIQIGVLILAGWWIAASFAVSLAAAKRGRSMGVWFWTSIFVGPILAVLLLLAYFVAELIEVERKGHSISQ